MLILLVFKHLYQKISFKFKHILGKNNSNEFNWIYWMHRNRVYRNHMAYIRVLWIIVPEHLCIWIYKYVDILKNIIYTWTLFIESFCWKQALVHQQNCPLKETTRFFSFSPVVDCLKVFDAWDKIWDNFPGCECLKTKFFPGHFNLLLDWCENQLCNLPTETFNAKHSTFSPIPSELINSALWIY